MSAAQSETHRGLTVEEVGLFHDQGFLVAGKLLEDDHVETLRAEYDRVFENARESGRYRNLSIDDTEDRNRKRKARSQMLQIMQMCERSIEFRKLLYHEPILDVVESLLGPNIQLFHDQALYKPPRQGGPVFWHQDNGYWQCTPANLVSCWLTLDDVDVVERGHAPDPGVAQAPGIPRAVGRDQRAPRPGRPGGFAKTDGGRPARRRRHVPPLPDHAPHPGKRHRPAAQGFRHPLHDARHKAHAGRGVHRCFLFTPHAADEGIGTRAEWRRGGRARSGDVEAARGGEKIEVARVGA